MTVTTTRFTTLERLGWMFLALAAAFGLGLVLDPRTVDGAPLWLKPAKFGVSLGLYSLTFAWILPQLTAKPRLARVAAAMTSVAFVIELVLIAGQAARGVSSHFNVSSPGNIVVYAVMGIAIMLQTLASLAVTVALWRQTFTDRALGWALRLGMLITVLGASTGGLMTQASRAQIAHAQATGVMTRAGGHTVGGDDGGAGLPGTGWSLEHGDLRVPHFLGLHAMQVLPLAAIWLAHRRARRRTTDAQAARQLTADAHVIVTAGVSYAMLFAILLAQALIGQSVARPAGAVLLAFAVWGIATTAALASALGRRARTFGVRASAMEVA